MNAEAYLSNLFGIFTDATNRGDIWRKYLRLYRVTRISAKQEGSVDPAVDDLARELGWIREFTPATRRAGASRR